MPIGSSISGQVGIGIESTPGTRVAPASWKQILQESMTAGRKTIRPQGIGGGGAIAQPRVLLGQEPGGQISMEGAAENLPTLLRLALGSPVTTGAGPYTHTYSFSLATPLPSATIQIGRPDVGGTVRCFEYTGCRASSWEMAVNPDDFVKFQYDLQGEITDESQTLGTPTWPTLTYFTSLHASLTLLGGAEEFDSLTIRGENNLDMSTVVTATNPGRRRIRQKGRPTLGGTFQQDFQDLALFNAFKAGTVGALSLVLNAGAAAQLTITGRVQFVEDNSPALSGPEEILKQSCPFEFVRDGANTDAQAFSAVLITSTATAV
jgi:hypothetical protein